ncbi:hypothetical protein EV687_0913 [Corticibacter populi]|nr:hypothetical protein EV687_0913 [Corticibacter populi]
MIRMRRHQCGGKRLHRLQLCLMPLEGRNDRLVDFLL